MSIISRNDVDGRPQIIHPGPYIIVMCGLPGAGKSTFRNMFQHNAVVLSTDDYVEEIANFRGKAYDDVWSDEIGNATAAIHDLFSDAIKQRRSIVWDQTNLTIKKRRKILSQLPKDYYKVAVLVEVHEDLRQERLTKRPGKTIPAHVDQSMRETLQVPTEEEGFDEVRCITMGPPHTGKKKTELSN